MKVLPKKVMWLLVCTSVCLAKSISRRVYEEHKGMGVIQSRKGRRLSMDLGEEEVQSPQTRELSRGRPSIYAHEGAPSIDNRLNASIARSEKRRQYMSFHGMDNPSPVFSVKRIESSKRDPSTSSENLESGLMRDHHLIPSRRMSLVGPQYHQQNQSDFRFPGAFRVSRNGVLMDEDSTGQTNTQHVPNASLVNDPYEVDYGIPVVRAQDGWVMTKRQVRAICFFFSVFFIGLVSAMIVSLKKESNHQFPTESPAATTPDNPSVNFPVTLGWSDDDRLDTSANDELKHKRGMFLSDAPTASPTGTNMVQISTPSEPPSERITYSPSLSPSKVPTTSPSMFPSMKPSLSPSRRVTSPPTVDVSDNPTSPPTLLPTTSKPTPSLSTNPSFYPSLRPSTEKPGNGNGNSNSKGEARK